MTKAKSDNGDAPPVDQTQAAPEAKAPTDAPVDFDPNHEWPAEGGCYVRQADGTLKRED